MANKNVAIYMPLSLLGNYDEANKAAAEFHTVFIGGFPMKCIIKRFLGPNDIKNAGWPGGVTYQVNEGSADEGGLERICAKYRCWGEETIDGIKMAPGCGARVIASPFGDRLLANVWGPTQQRDATPFDKVIRDNLPQMQLKLAAIGVDVK